MDFHNRKATFVASCNNQGMIRKCISNPPHRLRLHREANTDLFLVQRFYSNHINAQCHWVKGHTDKESWETLEQLKNQKLSTEETFNVWRDRLASNEWKNGTRPRCFPTRTMGHLFQSSHLSQITWKYVHRSRQCVIMGIHCHLHQKKTRFVTK
jgi:hypothetical protein